MAAPSLNLGGLGAPSAAGTTAMSEQEMLRLRARFDMVDADGSGSIDAEELRQLLIDLGREPSEYSLNTMMGLADKDASGTIEFEEFAALYGKHVEEEKDDETFNLSECFRVFDLDGNGYLDKNEIATIMGRLGTDTFRPPNPDFVAELVREADIDGDGRVSRRGDGQRCVHARVPCWALLLLLLTPPHSPHARVTDQL